MPLTPENLEIAKYRLEWWKLAVAALTPIGIAVLTYFVSSSLNERESVLRKSEQILSEKQKTYSKLGENLNIIYVYVADVGDFRQYTPSQVVDKKRNADRTFFMYRPYWSRETLGRYTEFMDSAFEMYTGVGKNARIRTNAREKKAAYALDNKPWQSDWDDSFTGQSDPNIKDRYDALVSAFLNDIATSTISTAELTKQSSAPAP